MNLNPKPLTDALQQAFASRPLRRVVLTAGVATVAAWMLVQHPPLQTVPAGQLAVRINQFSGADAVLGEGPAWRVPGLHELRRFVLRDQVTRPEGGRAPYQSVEGLSIGVDLVARWAVDPARVSAIARNLPPDLEREVVGPALQAVAHSTFSCARSSPAAAPRSSRRSKRTCANASPPTAWC
jgi:SPFH domain / Band 7 family